MYWFQKTTFRLIIYWASLLHFEAYIIITNARNNIPVTWYDLLLPGKESFVFIRVHLLMQERSLYKGGDKRVENFFSIKQKLIVGTFQWTEFLLNLIPSPIPIIFVLAHLVSFLFFLYYLKNYH